MNLRMPTTYWIYLLLVLPQICFAMNVDEFHKQMEKELKHLPANTEISFEAEVLGKRDTVLFSHQSDKLLIPASSMKLIVDVAAMDTLGPGFAFKTSVGVEGKRTGTTLNGNLVLRGNGDPFLVSERLYLLARQVARSGIREITGGIRIDNGFFGDDSRELLKFAASGEKYATVVSATSLDFNNVEIHLVPDLQNKRVLVESGPVPHDYAIIRNQVKLVSGRSVQVSIEPEGVQGDKEIFVARGTMGRDAPPKIDYASVANPSAYMAYAFAALLRAEGVKLGKSFAGVGKNITTSESITGIDSVPLMDLIRTLNTYSNNFMAEQIFQALGATQKGEPASSQKARDVIREYLARQGICKNIIIDNGSGLSWDARVNAKCFVDLLQNTYRDFRVFADLLGSMPVGGSTGTLKNRFKGMSASFDPMKVRAKTGTLWSVRPVTSLVGFTQTKSGETAVYAILLNNEKNKPALIQPMREWEEKCVDLLQQLQF